LEDIKLTYDAYGHCVVCHRNLIYEQVIGQKVTKRFSVDYAETEYLLDDKSKMRVAICKPCKSVITDEDSKKVMDCVKAGWAEEVKTLNWSAEKKTAYLKEYNKREIVCISENVPKDILVKKHEEYKEVKK
jgi:hypothetical protein